MIAFFLDFKFIEFSLFMNRQFFILNEWIWIEIIDVQYKLFLLLENNFGYYILWIYTYWNFNYLHLCIYVSIALFRQTSSKSIIWNFEKKWMKNSNCKVIKKIISKIKS